MILLPEDKLVWSPIVVNSRMNRERNASGINSYEKELKFKPEDFLAEKIATQGYASWLDLCCGKGNALVQTARHFEKTGQQHLIQLTGIDLLDGFQSPANIHCIKWISGSLIDWQADQRYDLITCIHGLHYIGDKLKAIEAAVNALQPMGLFIGHLDFNNVVIQGENTRSYLNTAFKRNNITYHSRRKLLERVGNKPVKFDAHYLGAADDVGPNYTGQDAVASHYAV